MLVSLGLLAVYLDVARRESGTWKAVVPRGYITWSWSRIPASRPSSGLGGIEILIALPSNARTLRVFRK